jgi:hypothetical protein
VAASSRRLSLFGASTDTGCARGGRGRIGRVEITVWRTVRGGCRFVTARGRLGARRSCRSPLRLRAITRNPTPGRGTWRLGLARPPRGRYVVSARAVDTRGNVERRGPTRRLTIT